MSVEKIFWSVLPLTHPSLDKTELRCQPRQKKPGFNVARTALRTALSCVSWGLQGCFVHPKGSDTSSLSPELCRGVLLCHLLRFKKKKKKESSSLPARPLLAWPVTSPSSAPVTQRYHK